jgi:hypothetical protein
MFENVFVGVDDPESGADALELARRLAYSSLGGRTGSSLKAGG